MLTINKNTNIYGISEIDGVQVATMNASISDNDYSFVNIQKTITNQELYNTNKVTVRQDINDFEDAVYNIADGSMQVVAVKK